MPFQNLRTGLRYLRQAQGGTVPQHGTFQNLRTGLRYLRPEIDEHHVFDQTVSKPSNRSQVFEDYPQNTYISQSLTKPNQ